MPFSAFSSDFQNSLEPSAKQSVVYVGSYDWGACIDKIVVNAGKTVAPQSVRAKDFSVNQILYPKSTNTGMEKGRLSITDAFCSDSKGNKIASPSAFITLLTDVHPLAENSDPFVSITFSSRFQPYYGYKIANKELEISVSKVQGFVNEDVTLFQTAEFTYDFIPAEGENSKAKKTTLVLPYVSYLPKTENKVPLILWFHGMGESGTNPYKVLFGTKSSAFANEKFQKYFQNGFAVLAPQCPTGWLETTEKGPGGARIWAPVDTDAPIEKIKKPVENFFNKFFPEDKAQKDERIPFAATSYYTEPVKELLRTFLEAHPEIDRNRIYVGGCSAGGYMTMNMMIQCPEIFAAAFPICEYYLDSKITDEQLKKLSEKPLWFTYALNDEAVKPEKNSIPTIQRLKDAGAKNLHVSEFRNVVDLSGKYLLAPDAKKGDANYGLPFEYNGHHSWIYVFNDECKDGDLSLFEWLSKQEL